jgi:PAS domain S-box-containing protein
MVVAEFFIPHGHCYLWKPELVGLHIISDALTALAYYSIPLMLTYFVVKRRDIPFNWIFLLFGAFIVSCGTTHIIEIWTLWHPDYWLSGLVKAFTALISLYTANQLVSLLPLALAMPSAAQFEAVKTEIQERQRAETELLREKTHLALAQKVAHTGSWEFDFAREQLAWSNEIFRIYDLPPDRPVLTFSEHRQAIHPEDRAVWDTAMNQLIQGQPCQLEYRIVRPDGSIRHILSQGEPICNADGQVEKLLGTVLDISDRIAAQQRERLVGEMLVKIRQSLELDEILNTTVTEVRQFLQTDRVVIYRFNPDWSGQVVVESVGDNWTTVLDKTIHDPCFGKDYTQLYQKGRVRAIANIHTAKLQPCHVELLTSFQVTANLIVPILQGETLWGLLIVHHCRGERQWQSYETEFLQQLAMQVAIALQQSELYAQVQSELIERQRIEQELRQQKGLLQTIFDRIPVMICLFDATGQLLLLNQEFERVLGWSLAEVEGIDLMSQCYPDPEYRLQVRDFMQQATGTWQDFKVRTRYGSDVDTSWANIRLPDGTRIGIGQDITERKRAEEALRTLGKQEREKAEQLNQALQELTRTQAQLVHNEKMASLGQLVAGVAHEINNPTSFIYGNIYPAKEYAQDLLHLVELYAKHYPEPVAEIAEHIEDMDLDFIAEDFSKLLASMKEGAQRISEIVQSLRNFSRLDEMECKQVNIHEGIDNTLLILKHRLAQQPSRPEIQIIQEYGQLPLVECYPSQLNQVFMNIISNAIDALEEGNASWPIGDEEENTNYPLPTIHIRTQVNEQNWVVIRIADNGSGLNPAVVPRIFDPFFTTKPPGKGTGLGLSISYQIVVEKHGGQLQCHSVPDRGAEFAIKVPIARRYSKYRQDVCSEESDRVMIHPY